MMDTALMDKRELRRYLSQPEAMYAGAPGKAGYLRMVFDLDDEGKSVMRQMLRRAPLIVQKELYFDEEMPRMPCVYILASGGPYVDGDRFHQEIVLRQDAYAHISTGAATKIAEMKANYAAMTQLITLDDGAYLEYLPEPCYPAMDSRFIADTRIRIANSATMVYAEIYMCGRRCYKEKLADGEVFRYDLLSVCCRAERLDGTALFREKFIIEPWRSHPKSVGVMADYEVFANMLVLTPLENRDLLYEELTPIIDSAAGISMGVGILPNDAGLIVKIMGMHPGDVKRRLREYASLVRKRVKGVALPPEFPWRL